MKQAIAGIFLATAVASSAGHAQGPSTAINSNAHPNLASAQQMVRMAHRKIAETEKENRSDFDGHTTRAMDLLTQADAELKAAAEASDAKRRSKQK